MIKQYLITTCFVLSAWLAHSQTTGKDSIPPLTENDLAIDTSINYDELFNDFELFMDSILAPRSYFLANLSVAKGYFHYVKRTYPRISVVKKNILSPGLGYYSKNGLGITVTGNVINDSSKLKLYQAAVSPSFDYLKNRNIAAGVSYMRYFTKDALPFYVSPLQNEFYGYFLWRKPWLQPGITANYGWGSRTEFKKRDSIYRILVADAVTRKSLRLLRSLRDLLDTTSILTSILTTNKQSIVDFTVTGSVRHDFYWLDIFSNKDYIKLSPLLSLSAGTQRFGFNRTSATYSGIKRASLSYSTETKNISLENKFKILSCSLYLRGEYSIGKFFLQPQLIFDYYFPATEDNLSAQFSLNAGFMF